jgi:thiol-disulfide isomerase/thioredoxin
MSFVVGARDRARPGIRPGIAGRERTRRDASFDEVSTSLHMPSFGGATEWLNSEPLGPAALHGRVVLVNFWTLTCINWLRQEPYVRAWSQAYRDDGLVVIGVHTPEFSFEHATGRVRQATAEHGIDYPVAIDNEYEVWDAFANRYWPALYFIDSAGIIRDQHFGEGRYERSERVIQQLLGAERSPVSVEAIGVEAQADWDHLRAPETYLGYGRSERFASPGGAAFDERRTYELPDRLRFNHWALAGVWTIGRENVALEQPGGRIAVRFHARDAHLVLSTGSQGAISFKVSLDGEVPGPSAGADVDDDGRGVVHDGRLYQLVREPELVRERTLEITFLEAGAQAFAFTFG